MAIFSYNRVKQGLGEAQATHKWNIRIPSAPSGIGASFPEELQIRATSTSVPAMGESMDFEVILHNHPINFNGGIKSNGSWSATFVEGTDMKVQEFFNSWINARFNKAGGDATGKSMDSKDLKCDIFIDMLNPADEVTATFQLSGCYVKPGASFELGQDAAAAQPSYEFSYDNIFAHTGGYNTTG